MVWLEKPPWCGTLIDEASKKNPYGRGMRKEIKPYRRWLTWRINKTQEPFPFFINRLSIFGINFIVLSTFSLVGDIAFSLQGNY